MTIDLVIIVADFPSRQKDKLRGMGTYLEIVLVL